MILVTRALARLLGGGSHACGVYPTQDTSRMRRAKVKQEKKEENSKKSEGKERPRWGLTSAEDLTIMLPEGRDSSCHRSDLITNLTYNLIYGPLGQLQH